MVAAVINKKQYIYIYIYIIKQTLILNSIFRFRRAYLDVAQYVQILHKYIRIMTKHIPLHLSVVLLVCSVVRVVVVRVLFACLFVCVSVCLSVCLVVCLFVCRCGGLFVCVC